MGKRGPRSKVTEETIELIKQRYQSGIPHRTIAEEVKISETNIRRILSQHSIPKRQRRLATLLSAAEESTMVDFLISQRNFHGKYRELRSIMESFAAEQGIRCPFTYSWRNGFVKRHSHNQEIPAHLLQLLSPKTDRTMGLNDAGYDDPDLTAITQAMQAKAAALSAIIPTTTVDVNAIQNASLLKTVIAPLALKGPSVWRQKPKLTLAQRAIKESTKAFLKAGLSRDDAHDLLLKLKVPGVATEPEPSQDVVAAAISDVFGEADIEPEMVQVVADQQTVASVQRPARKTPQKKDMLQVELLERVFQESPVCGDKRAKKLASILGLTPAQVIYWFHNTARHRRKMNNNAGTTVEESSVVTEITPDYSLTPLFSTSQV